MPPSIPPQLDDASSHHSRPATPNSVPSVNGTDDSTAGTSGGGRRDNEQIMVCMFDRKGYCVRHPHVRLRKKKLLGGWNVLITNCPDCCVEEMGRLKRVRKRIDKDKKKGNGKKEKVAKEKKKKKKAPRGVPDFDEEELQGQRSSRSRSRARNQPQQEEVDAKSVRSGTSRRGKSQDRRPSSDRGGAAHQDNLPSNDHHHQDIPSNADNNDNNAPIFEFDIRLDERGDVTSPRSVRSVKTSKSHKSSSSKKSTKSTRTSKSGKSARTNKSGKSTRTNKSSKSTRTNKSSKSTRTNKSDKSTRTNKTSKSRSSRRRSKSQSRDKASRRSSSSGPGETVISRGTTTGSSQRFIHQPNGRLLRVAKMPFTDKYSRSGNYTGDINEYGQPHGSGTLRYTNGMVYEGIWTEGHSEDMDANMGKATKHGFSGDWKSGTKIAKKEREKRKEQDMDDLRSFISQSVRSGMSGTNASESVGGGTSLQGGGSQYNNSINGNSNGRRPPPHSQQGQQGRPQQQTKEKVHKVPWSDVNGFSGHYTGEVNAQNVPDGRGFMQYSNGVVEEGMFCNGVYQPPTGPPMQSSFGSSGGLGGNDGGNQGVPSSSMSVWSLKSSPTMAFAQGGHNLLTGRPLGGNGGGGGSSSVMGAPTSVHLGCPGMYVNLDHRY